jgi:hypothetical protein
MNDIIDLQVLFCNLYHVFSLPPSFCLFFLFTCLFHQFPRQLFLFHVSPSYFHVVQRLQLFSATHRISSVQTDNVQQASRFIMQQAVMTTQAKSFPRETHQPAALFMIEEEKRKLEMNNVIHFSVKTNHNDETIFTDQEKDKHMKKFVNSLAKNMPRLDGEGQYTRHQIMKSLEKLAGLNEKLLAALLQHYHSFHNFIRATPQVRKMGRIKADRQI